MEGSAIQSCRRLTFSPCIFGICASTNALSGSSPAAASTAAGAAITATPDKAPCTKSRRLKASLESVMNIPFVVLIARHFDLNRPKDLKPLTALLAGIRSLVWKEIICECGYAESMGHCDCWNRGHGHNRLPLFLGIVHSALAGGIPLGLEDDYLGLCHREFLGGGGRRDHQRHLA